MFDVLVYLYENYWRPEACPDHEQLSRKLSAVGFESDEIHEALAWLEGLPHQPAATPQPQPSRHSMRIYLPQEQELLGQDCIGFITFLESTGVLGPDIRELVIDRATAAQGHAPGPLALEDLKVIVLMVFWSLGQEPDSLIFDELLIDSDERSIH